MKAPGITQVELIMLAVMGVGAFVAIKGIRGVASSAAGALVDAAGGVVTGTVDAAGQNVGLPALRDITDDPAVARWIIDNPAGGEFDASVWSSAYAFARAQFMDEGSGTPPPKGSKIAAKFPGYSGVVGSW